MKFQDQDWLDILCSLEQHHAIFYKLWQIGRPVFTEEVETAAVQFDKLGNFVVFLFNPNFWNSIDNYNRLFVICHECLHIILNHGARIKDSSFSNRQACNQCLDIVVNHLLIDGFGFDFEKIINKESYCWVKTVFPDEDLSSKETFEYYYNLFEKSYGDGGPSKELSTVDNHDSIDTTTQGLVKEFSSQLSNQEKESLSFVSKHFGQTAGSDFANVFGVKKLKHKWESVIKDWSIRSKKIIFRDIDQWARLNRRLSNLSGELLIPSEMEIEDFFLEKSKIKVSFFLDCSGSCWHLKERFFNAALSLDPKFFIVDLFCFDVNVHKIDLTERVVQGGGGTSFFVIEQFLQRSGENYPDGVFVITDGYGDSVYPEFPERWHWFLSEKGYSYLLPKKSNVYQLSNFE